MARWRGREHSYLMCPTASEDVHLLRLNHHSIEHFHALNSPTDISSLHFSGAADAGTRELGGLRAAMAGASACTILSTDTGSWGVGWAPRRPLRPALRADMISRFVSLA